MQTEIENISNKRMRFGIFCPPTIGHLNPMCVLGRELQRRGHTVVFFGVADALAKMANFVDFTLCEIGTEEYPKGSSDLVYRTLGTLTGRAGLKFTIALLQQEMQMLFREAPNAIRAAEIDILIVDQITLPIATVADFLNLPYLTVCNALPVDREPAVPPFSTHWTYQTTIWSRWRNQLGNALINFLTRDLWQKIVAQRQQWNLPPYQCRNDAYSPLAILCQLPKDFDFPRELLLAQRHYIGQFQDPSGTEPIGFKNVPFPFEQLDGRPLIYASLGTLQNQRPEVFELIAKACADVDAQLVISLGNPNAQLLNLTGNPIVVSYAPQQQLIQRSQLVITHAGINTVLTALSYGIPLLAIPITNDQPGTGARLQRSGAGKTIQLKQLDEITLRNAVAEILTQPNYRENACRMQKSIQEAGGVVRAVDIIEKVAQTRKPVVA